MSVTSLQRIHVHKMGNIKAVIRISRNPSPKLVLIRKLSDVKESAVAVITGASRGIGYATAKDMCSRLNSGFIYCTTRGSTSDHNRMIKEELGVKKDMIEFHTMEVTDIVSVVRLRNQIFEKHGEIDILINNAGMYFYPSNDPTEQFCQVGRTMAINYWGLKNVCNAFLPMLAENARIVNMSSHLGHLSSIPNTVLQNKLGDLSLTEEELDSLVLQYQNSNSGLRANAEAIGWPRCAYSVSKVAVNAYTRILQKHLEENQRSDVVVNSIHPGSFHSKITQDSPLTATEAAKNVVSTSFLPHPCEEPRGKFLWHDRQVVNWEQECVEKMRV